MNFIVQAIFGNLACTLWFCPPLCKLIHKLRGVRIRESATLFISRGVVLDNRYPELIDIGADVWLTQNVTVLTHSYSSHYQMQEFGLKEFIAAVNIERGVFVGTGSIILPGVTLGEGCYIGAGSVVTTSIPPGVLAVGNPCKVVRHLSV